MTDLAARLDGVVHEPTQVRDGAVDLTLADVRVVDDPGRLDFGGGEYEPAGFASVDTALRDPDDDYGWYDLAAGTYVVAFNESLAGDDPVRLQPRRELLACGATVPSLVTAALDPVPLTVAGRDGDGDAVRLKENARVATVRPV